MNIILLGAPGAGKGTQAQVISKRLNIPQVSTGNMIRDAIAAKTEMGLAAKAYIDDGKLVPDEVVIGIVKNALSSESCAGGFILDGFPRTIPQAEALESMGVKIDVVLDIRVADEEIAERIGGRRVCSKCGASYHVEFNPPKVEGVCDECGSALTQRADDSPEVVLKRLDVYHAQTEPLVRFYSERGLLKVIEGQKEVADTTALTLKALEE